MSDSVQTIKVGQRKYKLGPTLGVGGFSEVKKGIDEETRKRVALKIMYTDDSSQSDKKTQLNQVQKEIKAMKQLAHPNIIRLLGYDLKCVVGSRPAIVMVQQLAPKGELFDYLMYTKNFPEKQAIAVFHQLIGGLEAMHQAGIAHRDLKPENLLFDNNYNLKLADFGFSFMFQKGEGPKTAMRTELGTKGYMAPEIINNKKYTEKADIFASGVILFIMLAGFPPFQNAVKSDWWFDKLTKKKYKLFWMAHERTAKFSDEAKDILEKMLAEKDGDRPSVAEVKQTKFYNKECLTKEKLQEELKSRKKVVDKEKLKEKKNTNGDTMRDLFSDLLRNLPEELQPDLPAGKPLLLGSVLQNDLHDRLKKITSEGCDNYRTAVLDALSQYDKLTVEVRKDIIKDVKASSEESKSEEENWLSFAKNICDGAEMNREKFQASSGLKSGTAKLVQDALRNTNLGVIDDWELLSSCAKLDETELPAFEINKALNNSFKTSVSFGLLAYCMSRFSDGKGKLEIHQGDANMICKLKIKKPVILPVEGKDGTVQWKKGSMPVVLKTLISLTYDDAMKMNVISFRNISDDCMTFDEFNSVVTEITTNGVYNLAKFVQGRVEEEEFTDEPYGGEMQKYGIVTED